MFTSKFATIEGGCSVGAGVGLLAGAGEGVTCATGVGLLVGVEDGVAVVVEAGAQAASPTEYAKASGTKP
ncbi:MAG: hypothetical protein VKO21_11010 [Candidatus Sericytochromatia bacterium]|nr:hypothetical protein [Candidatus Sericytochromatia bacterium]